MWPLEGWGPELWEAQNFALFFPSPATHVRSFYLSLGVFSCFFGGVWKRRGRQMCTFGLSGCGVKPRRLNERTPKRERRKNENGSGRRKKRAKFLGGPAEGGPGGGWSWGVVRRSCGSPSPLPFPLNFYHCTFDKIIKFMILIVIVIVIDITGLSSMA